jgi:mono/diheme cytochrome c family protein
MMPGSRLACIAALAALMVAPAAAQDAEYRGERFAMQGGEAVYRNVCQGCHMADAQGAMGAGSYPALASNSRLANAGYVLTMVMNGHKGMPPFRGQFTDGQVADVVNFVRSHFGNRFKGTVSEADVKSMR